MPKPDETLIILAGATGDLGGRIARILLKKGTPVRVLVRPASKRDEIDALRQLGATIAEVDFDSLPQLTHACQGGTCIVSALSGLREVIVNTQTKLLNAAIEAGVPRFIPSDYCIDYTQTPEGTNRNLDLRREFRERLDKAPIQGTSILNGMFADLLTGQAPVVLYPFKRIVFWGNADQLMDFTTIANTAEYTASAALDPTTPRDLRIAGDVLSPRGLQEAASQATGDAYKLFRVGGLGTLDVMIKVTKTLMPAQDEVFPPWQGMQYLRNMLSGRAKLASLDNDRYPGIRWTRVQEVIARHVQEKS
ncbi:NmrA family NAD(P)-binding protein [Salmonirosea aquatica]|uniref:NAD(P)H-binding protein n=1 Tax=Salmonirosea aquatica TaxID=2654236 RepID=A0A7C9F8C4_9BACT|nr:NAD(P)H-binding protein [Cytophagaceae bacterium SJW1-29]